MWCRSRLNDADDDDAAVEVAILPDGRGGTNGA